MTKTAPWAVVALTAIMASPAVAQQKPNSADSDAAHVRALIQQAMQQVQPQTPAAPTGTPYTTPGTRVDLSIEEAVSRGMEKNIDIAVARITPRLSDFTILGLESNYRVNLTSAAGNT